MNYYQHAQWLNGRLTGHVIGRKNCILDIVWSEGSQWCINFVSVTLNLYRASVAGHTQP